MKKKVKHIILLVGIMFAVVFTASAKPLLFDLGFFGKMKYIRFKPLIINPPINRDAYLGKNINAVISCKGKIISVKKQKRYNKIFNAKIEDVHARRFNLKIIYNLFFDNRQVYSVLKKNSLYDFTGQLMTITPVSATRESYILDVVLKQGTIVLK